MSSLALPLDSGESSQSLSSRRQSGFTLQIVIMMSFMLGYGLHYTQTPIHYVTKCTINILQHHDHHHNCWPSSSFSEMGSRYLVESGVFMSSLSATIFIVALVTIGVLMLTLLIALTVMLESCKRSGSGVFDDVKKSDHHDHCNLFIFHAELNNLEVSEIPIMCKLHTFQFIKERYLRDLNTSLWIVEEYFSTLKPDKDGLDVILLDADDILSSTGNLSSISSLEWIKQFEDMNHQARMLIVRLWVQLEASNWSFILFSRKPAKLYTTWRTFIFSGHTGWSSLIMRSDDEIEMESWEYLSSRRLQLQKQQFRIAGLISSQLDAFRGSCLGKRNFKLPYPLFYELGEPDLGVEKY